MSAPVNQQYQNGAAVVTGDALNTFVQGTTVVSTLRQFIGLPGMNVLLQGIATAGDNGAGMFWWNPASTAADDGQNIIVPPAASSGAWNRLQLGANFSGPPNLLGYPLLQDGTQAYSLVEVTTTTVQPVVNEFAVSVNMISQTGHNSTVATSSNKVGIYVAVEAKVGSGNVWAINPVLGLDAGACLIGGAQIAELDLAQNSGIDYGDSIDTTGLAQPAVIGMQITGMGTNAASAAIAVLGSSTSKGGLWNAGVVFANNSTNRVSILDENSPYVSYKMLGTYHYGIDMASAAFNGGAIRWGAQQKILSLNQAGSGDLVLFQTSSTDQLLIGGVTVPTVVVNSNIVLAGTDLGFYGATPVGIPTITGSKGGNAALTSLLSALATLGLLVNSTT